MDQIPKHIKRALRQLADRACELELGCDVRQSDKSRE